MILLYLRVYVPLSPFPYTSTMLKLDHRLSCFVLVEIPLLFFLLAISLAHSLNTTLCLALTCGAYVDADVPGR